MITPSIINQHEYVSVNFGNGRRLTVSFNGEKAAGAVPHNVWATWTVLHQRKLPSAATAATLTDAQKAFLAGPLPEINGERVQAFVDQIAALWPEWNVAPPAFTVGQRVKLDFGPRRGGVDEGTVTAKVRTSYTVRWDRSGLIRVSADILSLATA